MIVLDTNVLSELLLSHPAPAVSRYVRESISTPPFITVITAAELRVGYAMLPQGRRRKELSDRVERLLTVTFSDRILPFDADASVHYAALMAHCRATGRPMPAFDALIAAIALSHRATLVTRNLRDFKFSQLTLINPWD